MVRPAPTPSVNASLRFALLAFVVSVMGGLVGWQLLGSANDPSPPILSALHANADPVVPPSRAPARRVVVTLLDGLGEDALEQLVARGELGAFDWHARIDVGAPSLSRPVYHVLLTGVSQPVSGVRNNRHSGRARADSVIDRLRDAGGSVAWGLESVPWLFDLFGREGDGLENGRAVASAAAFNRLYARGATLTIVHLVKPDGVGHAHGAASREYAETALATVRLVRAMHDSVAAHPDHSRTIWFVGADHGHLARGGHGGPELEVRRTAWYAIFPERSSDSPMVLPGRMPAVQIAATLAAALGIEPPRESLGEALPLPGVQPLRTVDVRARNDRVHAAFDRYEADARTAMGIRALVLAMGYAVLVAVCIRFQLVRSLLASGLVVAAASLAWVFAGPGVTLSAIRTHSSFVAHTWLVLAIATAATWPIARRLGGRVRGVLLLSALFPATSWIVIGGSTGRSMVDPVGLLVYPATGLVPAGVVLGLVLFGIARRLTRR